MNYAHLTIEERCRIREFYNNEKSFLEIAKLIGRSPSTVSREINRNRTNIKDASHTYNAHTAQRSIYQTKVMS